MIRKILYALFDIAAAVQENTEAQKRANEIAAARYELADETNGSLALLNQRLENIENQIIDLAQYLDIDLENGNAPLAMPLNGNGPNCTEPIAFPFPISDNVRKQQ